MRLAKLGKYLRAQITGEPMKFMTLSDLDRHGGNVTIRPHLPQLRPGHRPLSGPRNHRPRRTIRERARLLLAGTGSRKTPIKGLETCNPGRAAQARKPHQDFFLSRLRMTRPRRFPMLALKAAAIRSNESMVGFS